MKYLFKHAVLSKHDMNIIKNKPWQQPLIIDIDLELMTNMSGLDWSNAYEQPSFDRKSGSSQASLQFSGAGGGFQSCSSCRTWSDSTGWFPPAPAHLLRSPCTLTLV